ncbi:MAG: hypothetical protein Q9192_008795 [Flavoplaca navasiana]
MEGRGREWEKAVEMNIPVVRPEWVEGCEREGRIVGVRGYYLNADPKLRQVGQGVGLQQSPQRHQQQRRESQGPASSTASIPNDQLPNRSRQEITSPTPTNNLRPSNLPPPPLSPSEGGSPAPPPPAKDTPKTEIDAQLSPSESTVSGPVSPEANSAPSHTTSTDHVDQQQPYQNLKPAIPGDGVTSPKPGDNASMVDVAL